MRSTKDKALLMIGIIISMFVCFALGVLIGTIGAEPCDDNQSYSANEFLDLDSIDLEEIEGKEMIISDVYIEEVVTRSTGMFVKTEIGTIFFKDDEDALKVRAGETFTFKGRLSIDLDGEMSFHQSDYIMQRKED